MASNLDHFELVVPDAEEDSALAFARQIKALRRRCGGKQLWLAVAAGCSDAAVSFWETGKRIPDEVTIARIVVALNEAGALPDELARLQGTWRKARLIRMMRCSRTYRG
jgi:hypothetical protein